MKQILAITLLSITLVACAEVQSSSNKVFTNAGEVVKSGSEKMWIQTDEEKQKEEKNK